MRAFRNLAEYREKLQPEVVRGLTKVATELLWTCLTYNLQQWIRLNKLRATPAAT
jgi:hypothetical protein